MKNLLFLKLSILFMVIASLNIFSEDSDIIKKKCISILISGLNSNEKNIVLESIRISDSVGRDDLIYEIEKILKKSDNIEIRIEASYSLYKKKKNKKYLKDIFEVLKSKPVLPENPRARDYASFYINQNTRIRAAKILGEINIPESLIYLENIISSSNEYPPLVDQAMISFCRIKDRRYSNIFINALSSPEKEIVVKACNALGEIGERNTVKKLIPFLKSKDTIIVTSACEAIGKIGGKEDVKEIIPLLYNQTPEVRISACIAISNIEPEDYTSEIKNLLNDKNGMVRLHAYEALLKSGVENETDILLSSLESNDFDAIIKSLEIISKYKKNIIFIKILEKKLNNVYNNHLLSLNIAGTILKILENN